MRELLLEDDKVKAAAPLGRSGKSHGRSARKLREREDAALEAAGFERAGAGLWEKEGVYYGRIAAMQKAARSQPCW
jgi:hypothetical protein